MSRLHAKPACAPTSKLLVTMLNLQVVVTPPSLKITNAKLDFELAFTQCDSNVA